MIIYQRGVTTKLTVLRILSVLIISGIIYSSKLHIQNLFYFLIVSAIFLSLINVQDFIVTEQGLIVKKIYLFALVPFTWQFLKTDQIELYPASRFGENADVNYNLDYIDIPGPADEVALGVGCLLPFFYRPKISHMNFQIKKITALEVISTVSIELDAVEYRYAKTIADSYPHG